MSIVDDIVGAPKPKPKPKPKARKKGKRDKWGDMSVRERKEFLNTAYRAKKYPRLLSQRDLDVLAHIDNLDDVKEKTSKMDGIKRPLAVALIFTMITVLSDYYDSATRADNESLGRSPDHFGWELLNPMEYWRTWGLIGFAMVFFFTCYKKGIAPEGGL